MHQTTLQDPFYQGLWSGRRVSRSVCSQKLRSAALASLKGASKVVLFYLLATISIRLEYKACFITGSFNESVTGLR